MSIITLNAAVKATSNVDPVREVLTGRINRQFIGVDEGLVRQLYNKEFEYLAIVYEEPNTIAPTRIIDQFLVDSVDDAKTRIGKKKRFVLYGWHTLWGEVVVRV